jgi:hypothetical protein
MTGIDGIEPSRRRAIHPRREQTGLSALFGKGKLCALLSLTAVVCLPLGIPCIIFVAQYVSCGGTI